jgi:hypothetical protein
MKNADARILFSIGGVLFAGGMALLALAGVALRTGRLDMRPKHSTVPDSAWMYATQEPAWFYGIVALLTVFAVYIIVLSWRMMREARQGAAN